MSWYPNVDSIRDSLGNTLDITAGNVRVPARLQVGNVVKFRCIAWDPQDRELTWTPHADAHITPELDRQVGSEVTLGWNITEANVAETSIVVIQMRSDGRFHRLPWGVDSSISAFYAVDPPA